MMPGEDGLSLTRRLAADGIATPVLLLTALGEVDARIAGLEAGADDYLPKPFEPRELLLRINAVLRRHNAAPRDAAADRSGQANIGPWVFDQQRGELIGPDQARVGLTQVELTLLKALLSRQGTTVSREELASLCGVDAAERTIDVQVTRLRRKVETDPKQPRYIQTVRGKGYVLWME
jgi:two-component system phosphate regulon response regulator OmpR